MFRTIVINSGEKLNIKNNWLIVYTTGEESRIPIEDIYCIVVDNQLTLITAPTITALTDSGAHIILCDNKHMPKAVIYPLNTHYRPLNVIKRQISMSKELKDDIWNYIVKAKLYNQAQALTLSHIPNEKVIKLYDFIKEVVDGDIGNREAIGAKWYFRALYGSEFIRMHDDGINAALNYGYAILRSAITKTLVAYGFNCVIGIHHINESNPFNLADDLMEPLRPLVDYWVDRHHEDLFENLTRGQRSELVNLVNNYVLCDNKKMQVRNAIDKYISSFTTAIEREDPKSIKFPIIIENIDRMRVGEESD